jgi:transposase
MSTNIADLMNADLGTLPATNLSGRALQASVKRKLVEETHAEGSNYEMVMEKYNLGHDALRKYYKRVNRGLPMFAEGGRPTRLDDEGQKKVELFLQSSFSFRKKTMGAGNY